MHGVIRDFRWAVRSLLRTRSFTAIALVMLSGGIALNTAAFTCVNVLVTQPVPYPDPEQLIWVSGYNNEKHESTGLSTADVARVQASSRSLQSLGAFRERAFNVSGDTAQGAEVTQGLIETLKLQPIRGRGFTSAEYRGEGPRVVLIGERLWQNQFGSDPSIVGREIRLDGESHTVVGVMPRVYRSFFTRCDVWKPLSSDLQNQATRNLPVLARLKPESGAAQAETEIQSITGHSGSPGSGGDWEVHVSSVAAMAAHVVPMYLVLFGVVFLVLMVICANLASLQVARAISRQKDVAVRMALGASRFSILRPLLAEGIVLGLSSGLAGLVLTIWVRSILISSVPQLKELAISGRVFGFVLIVSVFTGLAFALAPAWSVCRTSVSEVIKSTSAGGAGSHRRIRQLLTVGEIAVAVALLAGVGVLFRSFLSVTQANAGFRTENLLTASVSLPDSRYVTPEARIRFFTEASHRIASVPGVQSVTICSKIPLTGGIEELKLTADRWNDTQRLGGRCTVIAPQYLETLEIRLLQGRAFTPADHSAAERVVLVNRKLADKLWPGESPLGKHIQLEGQEPFRIIGAIENVNQDLTSEPAPEILLPLSQHARSEMSFLIRTGPDSAGAVSGLRREINALDPILAISSIQTMEQIITGYFPIALVIGCAAFAAITLFLAAVGLYGVISHLVNLRSREIGIRIALGACSTRITRLIMGDGLRLTAIGAAIGLAAGLAISRVLSGLLFGVQAADPVIFGSIILVVFAVSSLALLAPAHRASRLEPIKVLRSE